jgi:hypothetical protein
LAAAGEHRRVRPAPVEPDHDLLPGGDVEQVRQHLGQRLGQPGGFALGEGDRAAGVVDHQGVGAAFLSPSTFVVVSLAHRFRAGVGDEVVIDEVHLQFGGVGGQHRRSQRALDGHRVAGIGDARQPGPQRPQLRQPGDPGQRPDLVTDQVLDLLDGARPEREHGAHPGQHRHIVEPWRHRTCRAGRRRGGKHPGRADPVIERVQHHRPGIPGRDHALTQPRRGRLHLRVRLRLGLRLGLGVGFWPRPGCAGPHVRLSTAVTVGLGVGVGVRVEVQPKGLAGLLLAAAGPDQTRDHRVRHPEPGRDLHAGHALTGPRPRLRDLSVAERLRPAHCLDQTRRPLCVSPAAQHRHIRGRDAEQRGDLAHPAVSQRVRQRHDHQVPHAQITGVIEEQHP